MNILFNYVISGGMNMSKHICIILISFLITIPSYSQENSQEQEDEKKAESTLDDSKMTIGDQTYYETIIEDFENTEYTERNIKYFAKSEEEKAGIVIREGYAAPVKNSKKYLGIKLYGKEGNVLQITPEKKLLIDKYCRSISIWIFGKNFAGELSMMMRDAEGRAHRIVIGKLKFIGWRKLIIKLPDSIVQKDKYLTKKKHIEITKFIYKPTTKTRLPVWHYFYMDNIGAMVREKYTDKQSDDW